MSAIHPQGGNHRPNALAVRFTSLCLGLALSAGAAGAHAGQSKLVGVWKNEIEFVDCTTGQGTAPPGIGLHTYYADGNLLQTSGINPTEGGSSQGRWSKTGKNTFAARTRDFRFDVNGAYWGYIILDRMITLAKDGQTLEFNARGSFYSMDDQYLGATCALGKGEKLPEPTPF